MYVAARQGVTYGSPENDAAGPGNPWTAVPSALTFQIRDTAEWEPVEF